MQQGNAWIHEYMKCALKQAHLSKAMNEVPVGCVFVDADRIDEGEQAIVAKAHNLTNLTKNATNHCEILCINQLKQYETDFQKLILFVTCEPCIMCAYALKLVGIKMVYFGCFNHRFGGNGSVISVQGYPTQGGFLEEECMGVLQTFYEEGNQNISEQYRHRKKKAIKM